jgi:RimJ/RimL family protein N-acetyltransferase
VSPRPWPVTLTQDEVQLRPLRHSDASTWREVRRRNVDWLRPWEATLPPEALAVGETPPTFSMMVRRLRREARAAHTLPWVLAYQGRLVGQVTVGGISWGSLRSGYVGYWIDKQVAGRGIMPLAVAMACDYSLNVMRLHRIEINIRPPRCGWWTNSVCGRRATAPTTSISMANGVTTSLSSCMRARCPAGWWPGTSRHADSPDARLRYEQEVTA